MNNIKSLVSLSAAFLLILGACSSDGSEDVKVNEKVEIAVSTSSLTILNGSSATFQVTAPSDERWEISVPGDNDWLTVSPITGVGSETVTCSVAKNEFDYRVKHLTKVNLKFDSNKSFNVTLKDSLPNQNPAATKSAVYPENGAKDVPDSKLRFIWSDANDPDNDKLYYELEYSEDKTIWTKTYTEFEVPFFISTTKTKSNTTYYWRVKTIDHFGGESDYSEVFSFTTAESAGDWKDGEVRLYQDCCVKDATDPFTVIITGDGFTADEMKADGAFDQYSLSCIEGLLTKAEPYKTWGSYLRIYRVGAISNQSGISEHQSGDTNGICNTVVDTKFGSMYDNVSSSAWCGMFSVVSPSTGGSFDKTYNWVDTQLKAAGVNVTKNYCLFVIQNVKHYNGSVNYFTDGKNRTLGFVCMTTGTDGTQTGLSNVVLHEIGGHGIGHLADLYTKSGTLTETKKQQTIKYQNLGWYQNVSVDEDKAKAPWAFFFDKPEHSVYYSTVGFYEGARSATKGIWRSQSAATCMNDNSFIFDAPSRWSIVKQLKQAAGEELTWEEFVNKDYDRLNVNFTTKSCVLLENLPDLPEPVVID